MRQDDVVDTALSSDPPRGPGTAVDPHAFSTAIAGMGTVIFEPATRAGAMARSRRGTRGRPTPAGRATETTPAAAWSRSREAALRDAVAHRLTSSPIPGTRALLNLLVALYRAACRLRAALGGRLAQRRA